MRRRWRQPRTDTDESLTFRDLHGCDPPYWNAERAMLGDEGRSGVLDLCGGANKRPPIRGVPFTVDVSNLGVRQEAFPCTGASPWMVSAPISDRGSNSDSILVNRDGPRWCGNGDRGP